MKKMQKIKRRRNNNISRLKQLRFNSQRNIPNPASTKTELISEAYPIPYDENLLERARTQWQFGDWDSLVKLTLESLQHHPERAKLALLSAAGHLQQGNTSVAMQFICLAQEWGCSKKIISQILIAGVHNNLAKASVIAGKHMQAFSHFECSIETGTPGGDKGLLTNARTGRELSSLETTLFCDKPPQSKIAKIPYYSFRNYDIIPDKIGTPSTDLSESNGPIKNYGIYNEYQSSKEYIHREPAPEDKYQLEVYLHAYGLMAKNNFCKIADIGCGTGYKLITYLNQFETVGFELPTKVEWLKSKYPEREWRVSDFSKTNIIRADVIICADVIEHLVDPDELIQFLKKQSFKYLVISTPNRDMLHKEGSKGRKGPPTDIGHQREWNFTEFSAYIKDNFDIIIHRITNPEQSTQMIICTMKVEHFK
jgi:hypothetical protein